MVTKMDRRNHTIAIEAGNVVVLINRTDDGEERFLVNGMPLDVKDPRVVFDGAEALVTFRLPLARLRTERVFEPTPAPTKESR